MKGLMPQEMEVWYLIPAIRSQLSLELLGLGLKQKEIAEALGVTEAAISQYVSGKRATGIDFGAKMRKEMKESGRKIFSDRRSATREMKRILDAARKTKLLCRIHERYGVAERGCKICGC